MTGGEPRVNELVEHLFRHQAGQMLATLTQVLGLENLDLAEEVVNARYGAHTGANLVREGLCGEAIRLAQLMTTLPDTSLPKVHALLALFYFQAARLGRPGWTSKAICC